MTQPGPDLRIAEIAKRQWGIVTLADLVALGFSRQAIKLRLRNGRLHRLHRGVYAVGHRSLPFEAGMLAAVRACGEAAWLSHFAGCALREFVDWDGRLPEVTVRGSGTRIAPGIRVHRSAMLDPSDVTIVKGIPVTTPARSLIDLAAVVSYPELRRAVRRALGMERVTIGALAKQLARLRPRRGAANLARIIADGQAPTRSELEDVVLELVLGAGFAMPDVNRPLILHGRKVIPDFRWPEQKLIVEADGAAWHDNKLAREDDAERQALLEASGERIVRVTWDQAVARSAETIRRLESAGAPHAGRPSS